MNVFYWLLSSVTVILILGVQPATAGEKFLFLTNFEAALLADAIDPDLYAFLQIIKQFGSEYASKLTTPELRLLVNPEVFSNSQLFDIRSMTAAGFLSPPSVEEVLRFFQQRLESFDFEFSAIGRYRNEVVYRVRRGNFQINLLLVPTTLRIADGRPGTAVILASPELPLDSLAVP